MIVNQAFRYELDPNDRQRTLLAKHAGVARFAWNWALARRIGRFQQNKGNAARNLAWYGQFGLPAPQSTATRQAGRNQHACGELCVGGTGPQASVYETWLDEAGSKHHSGQCPEWACLPRRFALRRRQVSFAER